MRAAVPVRHYLTDISGEVSRHLGESGHAARGADVEARLEQARLQGAQEARVEAEREHAAALAAQQAQFDVKLAAERARWVKTEGGRLAELLTTGLRDIEHAIADCVGRVLKPIVSEEVRRGAVSSLAQALQEMIYKGTSQKITVFGPQDLLTVLEAHLEDARSAVRFETSHGTDLVVYADDTVLETRIGAWTRSLSGASEASSTTAAASTDALNGETTSDETSGGAT